MTRVRLTVAAMLAVAACGGGPTQPAAVPGDLIVSVAMPGAEAGALLIRVVGNVSNVTSLGNYRVSFTGDSSITRVVLTGAVASGDIFKIHVPDVEKFGNYSAFVEQAASGADYSLLSTSGYAFTIRK
jgi:hypothetical protein